MDIEGAHELDVVDHAGHSISDHASTTPNESGFPFIDGDVGGPGYNETTVDIVTVPCPGADPVETWTRDPLPGNSVEVLSSSQTRPAVGRLDPNVILSPGIRVRAAPHKWVRHGIRHAVSTARVLMYRHHDLAHTTTLDVLAEDLLARVYELHAQVHRVSRSGGSG